MAGGQSTRMGRDKAGLNWDGQTLLQRTKTLLCETGCETVRISGRDDLEDGFADTRPGEGPAQALIDAVDLALKTGHSGILAVPVDMPKLTPDQLRPLMEGDAGQARIWKRNPLPAYLPALTGHYPRHDVRRIRDLLALANVETRDLPDIWKELMVNINTPEAFAALDIK